jgi:hypothetical protein
MGGDKFSAHYFSSQINGVAMVTVRKGLFFEQLGWLSAFGSKADNVGPNLRGGFGGWGSKIGAGLYGRTGPGSTLSTTPR